MKSLKVFIVVMMQIYGMVVQASQDHDHNPNDCSAETVSTTAASGDYGQYGGQRRESSSSSQEQSQLVDSMPVYGESFDFLNDDESSSDFSGVITPNTPGIPESTNVTSVVGSPSSDQNSYFPTAQRDRSLSAMKISNEGLDQLPSTPQSKCPARLSSLEYKSISQEAMNALCHSVIVRDSLRTRKLKDVTYDTTNAPYFFCKDGLPAVLPHDIVCLFGSVPPTSGEQQMRWKRIDPRNFKKEYSDHECVVMIKGEQNRKVVEDICRSK